MEKQQLKFIGLIALFKEFFINYLIFFLFLINLLVSHILNLYFLLISNIIRIIKIK